MLIFVLNWRTACGFTHLCHRSDFGGLEGKKGENKLCKSFSFRLLVFGASGQKIVDTKNTHFCVIFLDKWRTNVKGVFCAICQSPTVALRNYTWRNIRQVESYTDLLIWHKKWWLKLTPSCFSIINRTCSWSFFSVNVRMKVFKNTCNKSNMINWQVRLRGKKTFFIF